MKVPARMIRQPLQDRGRLVGGDIVQNDMDIPVGVEAFGHRVEKGDEVFGALPLRHAARDVTRGDIQGDQQAGGAMADIVMGPGRGVSRRLADRETRTREVAAWQAAINADPRPVKWRFTVAEARIKLHSFYPSIQ